jgi:hypothetical protein
VKDDTSLRLDTRDYGTLFQRLIREPLQGLLIVDPILVVIDALDESGDTIGEKGLHRFLADKPLLTAGGTSVYSSRRGRSMASSLRFSRRKLL